MRRGGGAQSEAKGPSAEVGAGDAGVVNRSEGQEAGLFRRDEPQAGPSRNVGPGMSSQNKNKNKSKPYSPVRPLLLAMSYYSRLLT